MCIYWININLKKNNELFFIFIQKLYHFFFQERMVGNGNSPLESMRTLEHYLSDIMRAGATETPEHMKGKFQK